MRFQISRRAVLQLIAATAIACLRKDARADAAPAMRELMDLAIDPRTVTLAPEAALQRIAFLGASSTKEEGDRWLVYRLEDGQLARGSLRFSKLGNNRWRLDRMQLFFGMDDEVLLDPLREALTKHLGEPQDATMTPQSNTQLQWRADDRLVEIMADVPAITPKRVYGVIIRGL